MRTLKIMVEHRHESDDWPVLEIGTNVRDGGLFCRKPDGRWSQFAGNGQTPTFKSPAHVMRYLRARHYPDTQISMVRGSADGW